MAKCYPFLQGCFCSAASCKIYYRFISLCKHILSIATALCFIISTHPSASQILFTDNTDPEIFLVIADIPFKLLYNKYREAGYTTDAAAFIISTIEASGMR
jgi:hypothetical protein